MRNGFSIWYHSEAAEDSGLLAAGRTVRMLPAILAQAMFSCQMTPAATVAATAATVAAKRL